MCTYLHRDGRVNCFTFHTPDIWPPEPPVGLLPGDVNDPSDPGQGLFIHAQIDDRCHGHIQLLGREISPQKQHTLATPQSKMNLLHEQPSHSSN